MKTKPNNISCVWGLLCEGSSIDAETNNITIFKVIEELSFVVGDRTERVAIGKMKKQALNLRVALELIVLWRKQDQDREESFESRLQFIGPDGVILQDESLPILMTEKMEQLRVKSRINHLAVTTSGGYFFKIQVRTRGSKAFRDVGEIPLRVTIKEEKKNVA